MVNTLFRQLGILLLLGLAATPLACTAGRASPPPPPRLLLFLVVDQMRADYLERFRPYFTGGLRRLLEESVVFTDAHHRHVPTSTAPGHATLASGRHPRHHGIVDNSWIDRGSGRVRRAVHDPDHGSSPRQLLVPTLGDWLRQAHPESRVFAVGAKDRAVILTGGKAAEAAFWFREVQGRFATSGYYPLRRPAWLEEFRRELPVERFFGSLWQPLPATLRAVRQLGLAPLDRGVLGEPFPHPLGAATLSPDHRFYAALYESPLIDAQVVALARALIDGEGLGGDGAPDFLGLCFSALDAVGHRYGPDSPEVADAVLRLDHILGELLDFVDRRIGLDRVVVSLASDHGVVPVPEVRGEPGQRFGAAEIACFQQVPGKLVERLGDGPWLLRELYLDRPRLAERGVAAARVEDELRRLLLACPGVERVWSRSDLEVPPAADDPLWQLYANGFHPQRSADLAVQLAPYTLAERHIEANHGSPYPYDTHVPWLVRLPRPVPRTVAERVYTVDVAPTLATLLGLAPGTVDGVDRGAWLRADR